MGWWRGLEVDGRQVLVDDDGKRTLGTVAGLLEAGARVLLVSAAPTQALTDLADRGLIRICSPTQLGDDLTGITLAVVDNDRAAPAVRQWADTHGVLLYAIDLAAGGDRPTASATGHRGEVVLVGGGPGDVGLLTLAGLQAIKDADVIATDRLAPLAALDHARPDVEIIDVGKIPRGRSTGQRSIEDLIIERARAGKRVVRFKGGDSFVFGRGGEEWQACAAAGIPVTVIPGVTSATAAPAVVGIPVTHRSLSQGFTAVTGHVPPGDPRSTIDWTALARSGSTLVIMMGMANLAAIAETLIGSGLPADTPAAVIADGTMSSMRFVRAQLSNVASEAAANGLGAPATVVIGAVAGFDANPAGSSIGHHRT